MLSKGTGATREAPLRHPPCVPLALTQTREALIKILDDLSPHDQFDLISFSAEATTWKPLLVPASTENVNEAKNYATGIQAQGGECLCSPAW